MGTGFVLQEKLSFLNNERENPTAIYTNLNGNTFRCTQPNFYNMQVNRLTKKYNGLHSHILLRRQTPRWRLHGEWSLPFEDHCYFDTMLDAWVGYIFPCQVVSRSSTSLSPPDCKRLQERLLCNPPNTRLPTPKATLTHVGNDIKFCLAEYGLREGDDSFGRDGCVLHITRFGLKYSHKGELQTMNHINNSYTVSKHAPLFSPVAFWM
jgi:hypothetical protein